MTVHNQNTGQNKRSRGSVSAQFPCIPNTHFFFLSCLRFKDPAGIPNRQLGQAHPLAQRTGLPKETIVAEISLMHRFLRTALRVGTLLLGSALPMCWIATEPSRSGFGGADAWKKCGDPSCHSKDEFAALLKNKRSSSTVSPVNPLITTPEDRSKRCPLMREQLGRSTWNLVRFWA